MQVRFWGTRGSLPKPGASTVRYGGNTACVELRSAGSALVVLDCGTGAHGLGQSLMGTGGPIRGHLLITHTHWDHIQGFPFFAPLFVPLNEWDLYAPGGLGQQLETTLAGQMEYTYFPVTLGQLGATIRFHDLLEGSFDIGGVRVTTRFLNHPAVTLGYRLEADGATVVYATDHEPHSPFLERALRPHDGGRHPAQPVHQEDQRHLAFISGADLLIHDAQYTVQEYGAKHGWGHTPAEWAVDMAVAAGVRRLALFHHDPLRSDEALDALVETCRRRAAAAGAGLDVFGATEGLELYLAGALPGAGTESAPAAAKPAPPGTPVQADATAARRWTVLIADDDPDVVELLSIELSPEGFRLLTAYDGQEAERVIRAERPDLILLDWRMPGSTGLEVARKLRAERDAYFREVPVVLLTSMVGAEETAAAFEAGATDYLTKPFTPANIRSRVRGWLLRSGGPSRSGGPHT